ncbi:MAG: tRNA (cytidine(34)-2'-O)-methyltransferase [Parvibaculaceae bacterium]|nr:tRNA (cytidine(34)-2'-O)-methyltransferase [Parvibaculaceae bacterium]
MHIALYQPDIPQNTGTILRLGACMGVSVSIIEPCGFPFSDRGLKRAGMDYLAQADISRHESWEAFLAARPPQSRLVLATTRGGLPYTEFSFARDDILLLGRESAGVPEAVHNVADARLIVPMRAETRSLNVALAAAMILGEALRQTSQFPASPPCA